MSRFRADMSCSVAGVALESLSQARSKRISRHVNPDLSHQGTGRHILQHIHLLFFGKSCVVVQPAMICDLFTLRIS